MVVISRISNYVYISDNYTFKADVDEFRVLMFTSALIYEITKHTEGGWISMNNFCQKAVRFNGIYLSYDKAQYILSLLANEHILEKDKVVQKGVIRIEQDIYSRTKKIMPNGEKGAEVLKRRMENIMGLSQRELSEFEQGGAHKEKGNKKAFRIFAEWKTKHDADNSWLIFVHTLLYGKK